MPSYTTDSLYPRAFGHEDFKTARKGGRYRKFFIMPSISEKLAIERKNVRTVILWPEGSFYKAYERSAYLFVTHFRAYEVRRKFVEAAGQDVLSVGFPQTVIHGLDKPAKVGDDGVAKITLESGPDEQQFLQWRESIPMLDTFKRESRRQPAHETAMLPTMSSDKDLSSESVVANRIRRLDLSAITPMQCILLLSELQQILKQDDE